MDGFIVAEYCNTILTGKMSLEFYCLMAQTDSDNENKSLSDLLGRDDVVHLETFVLRYPVDEFDLLALVSSQSARDHPAGFVTVVRDGQLYVRNAQEISF